MKNYYKNNKKGITLVALVITIVILLIIAGVSISAITKDNGLITKNNYDELIINELIINQ